MSKKDKTNTEQATKNSGFLFSKTNFYIMIIGLVFIGVGFMLMSGGESENTAVFNEAIYNFRRIRLAPTLVLIGLGLQVYAVLYRGKKV